MSTIPESLSNALRHHQAGRLQAAEQIYRQILAADPRQVDALHLLGVVSFQLGRHAAAITYLEGAIRLKATDAAYHCNLGNALQAQGKLVEALASYRRALELKPDHAGAHNNMGTVLQAQGLLKEALASYRRAVDLKPTYAEAHNNLGIALQALGQLDAALVSYRRATELKPDYAEAEDNLGTVLQAQGKLEEALASHRRALELKPDYVEAHNNLGLVLQTQGKLDEALASYRRALESKPDYAEAHNNLGNIWLAQGDLADAEASYRRALELRPDYAEAHSNQAVVWLLLGDFARGWREYEWRWRRKKASPRSFRSPRWTGEPLKGKTILLYAEQGLGDTIHFIRYAPLVQLRGARVVFECPVALHRLLAGFRGLDELVLAGSPLPEFDVQAPLMSLPGILGTTLATIPADVPYLQAAPELVEHWRSELSPLAGLKVGLCWQGSPRYKGDRDRSFPLACLEPLGQCQGVQLISLQKGLGSEQLRAVGDRFFVHDLGSGLDESSGPFMDTAAVMLNLDLVITADTAVAHLAGALGVPVWLALTRIPHWPWLLDREDSPWYPTLRLFRQRQLGDWAEVFDRMATVLRDRVASTGPRPALEDGFGVRSRDEGGDATQATHSGSDLQSVINAWAYLPESVKVAVMTLVTGSRQTCRETNGS